MIIKCPECELNVSDKALSCPHCGYPMRTSISKATKRKHRRLPNGFGQITKIKNKNLRKPYRASVTVGKTSDGKCMKKLLKPQAYFETYNDAYAALVEYNRNPYDLDDTITVSKLYTRWFDEYAKTLSSNTSKRTITSAWKYCKAVYDMRAKDIRARHIKGCMESCKSPNLKSRIKSLFNLMLDYALEYEIVDKNYARTFQISDDVLKDVNKVKRGHLTFKDEEIVALWENRDTYPVINIILFQCYTGFRPQEIGLIKRENINLDKNIIVGGMKTDAGRNRIVPIHPKIKGIVKDLYMESEKLNSEYLVNCTDTHTHRSSYLFTYDKYRHRFEHVRDLLRLDPSHRAHDPRKYFITQAKKYNVDEYAIKYIVGHSITDLTEKVYTDRDISWLQSEIEKIK